MDEEIETLMVDVRASTAGFKADIEAMRGTFDATLVDGFARAGAVLERGLLHAIRRGSVGFDDLKRVALATFDEIAAQAVRGGIGALLGSAPAASTGGLGAILAGAVGALFGLPGRATGGPVTPGAAYLVGERGPEVFVPTSAGRIESPPAGPAREVRVSIQVAVPRGENAPATLQRSSRQIASHVRRALREA